MSTRATGALLAICAIGLAGCGSEVSGHPVTAATRHIGAQLGSLLPADADYPANYGGGLTLPPEAAALATGDLAGAGRGAIVTPAGCAPPEQQSGPDRTAVAVANDNVARATLTVVLTRTDKPLSAWRSQLRQCKSFRVDKAGAKSTVTTTLDPSPPADAEDTLAFRRTVAPEVSLPGVAATMQTSAGQIGDVRISVAYMTFEGRKPDTEALNALFTAALAKVGRAA
ncbi:sensor domain-containing protein [Nocardia panacis]|uniref:Sensor domain-containing protein n=1 Tax=Nocardia panacis TaxID=2340916 RepID=A0A3A4JYK5_9NOCA|nr:sensor domain-containing protein [Nocardia panacis]